MAQGMNKVILLGNLGDTPELRFAPSGLAVLKLRLATDESWVDREGNRRQATEWHRATLFGKRAEALAKHLRRGTGVLIEGRLRTSSYDKEGQKHYSTEVLVDDLCFASGAARADGSTSQRDEQRSTGPATAQPGLASGHRSPYSPVGSVGRAETSWSASAASAPPGG